MHILILNSGSSSIKCRLYDMRNESLMLSGKVERIGEPDSTIDIRLHNTSAITQTDKQALPVADHHAGLKLMLDYLQAKTPAGWMQSLHAIGHRVVHGGEDFHDPVVIDETVIERIRNTIALAPLHNPASLACIEAARGMFPQVPQVAVFDTAFFRNLPAVACRYALPDYLYRQHHVRRYGFHGISHRYASLQAAAYLQRPVESLRLITLHLGNGASVAAIRNGECIDTSMGMTPLEGLIMGSRCGDLDPSIHFYLARTLGMSNDDIETLLNRHSGMQGLCGASDMREIHRLADQADEQARLAIDMYCYRIAKYIGAYYVALDGLDALIFTGGIGENDAAIRQAVCQKCSLLGITLDKHRNQSNKNATAIVITTDKSRVSALVITTNEELEIARQTSTTVEHLTIQTG